MDQFLTEKVSRDQESPSVYKGQKPFECEICGARFSTKPCLHRHMRIHPGVKSYKCDRCEYQSNKNSDLREHRKTTHENEIRDERALQCSYCDRKFNGQFNLAVHERSHTGERPFECDQCGLRFPKKSNLNVHMRIHIGDKSFNCVVCNTAFFTQGLLNRHMITHTEDRPYKCEICDYRAKMKNTLSIHVQKMHIDFKGKEYACNICKYVTKKKRDLKSHIEFHEEEEEKIRNRTCQYCDLDCKTNSKRIEHEKKHTGEKPFECNICGGRFFRKDSLKRHMIKVHDVADQPLKTIQAKEVKIFGTEKLQDKKVPNSLNKQLTTNSDEQPFKTIQPKEGKIFATDNSPLGSNEESKPKLLFFNADELSADATLLDNNESDSSDSEAGRDSDEESYSEDSETSDTKEQQSFNSEFQEAKLLSEAKPSTTECTVLPLSVLVWRKAMEKKNQILLIWLKKLETDVFSTAKMFPDRCILFCQQVQNSAKYQSTELERIRFIVKSNNISVEWEMYSLGYSKSFNQLKDKQFESYGEVESIMCRTTESENMISIIRYSEKEVLDSVKDQLQNTIVVCNYS